jgi:hypothetical protein
VVPAFATSPTPTATSMTFYSDIGYTKGPVKVTAACTATTASGRTTLCKVGGTFTVTLTYPKGTCPFVSTTTAKSCVWTTAHARTLVTITGVNNGKNTRPLFIYSWHTATSTSGTTHVVCVPQGTVNAQRTCTTTTPTYKTTDTTDVKAFGSCTKPTSGAATFSKCNVGSINEVSYDLEINSNTSALHGGSQAEDDTGVFTLSSTSMTYNPTVG